MELENKKPPSNKPISKLIVKVFAVIAREVKREPDILEMFGLVDSHLG